MAFEIKRKAELTLVSLLAELIDPSGRQRLMPAPQLRFSQESLWQATAKA